MYARTSEETYTLAEAKRIINEEKLQKRELLLHKAKQKLLGIITIGISIIIPFIMDGDATVLRIPLERNSQSAIAVRLSAPNGKFY